MDTDKSIDNKKSDLKRKAINSAKWSSISNFTCTFIKIVKFGTLARLIAKEDFGIFASISVVIGLADKFVEAGLGSAIIHKQNATKEELASSYTINIILGVLIFSILYFASWPIASFYNQIRLIELLHFSSLIFLIQPLGRQYDALFRRDLHFNIVAFINILSELIGVICSIVIAFLGYGVYALIVSQLTQVLVRNILLLCVGIPKFGFNIGLYKKEMGFFLKFGAFQIGNSSINYFSGEIASILIGKFIGQESLGEFFMAKQLAQRPISIINPVITSVSLPVFAKIQNDKESLKKGYLKIINSIGILQFAIYFIIAAFSKEIALIFLGDKWDNAYLILSILCIGKMFSSVENPIGSLQQALGRADLEFYWNLGMFFLILPINYFSCQYGSIGVACGIAISCLISFFLSWYFLIRKLCNISFSEFYFPLFKILLVNVCCFSFLFIPVNIVIKIIIFLLSLFIYLYIYKSEINYFRK